MPRFTHGAPSLHRRSGLAVLAVLRVIWSHAWYSPWQEAPRSEATLKRKKAFRGLLAGVFVFAGIYLVIAVVCGGSVKPSMFYAGWGGLTTMTNSCIKTGLALATNSR